MSESSIMSVIQLISIILADDPNLQQYSVKLNSKSLKFLNDVISEHPDALEQFKTLFEQITDDGKIDISDVPAMLNLLKVLYELSKDMVIYDVKVEDVVSVSQFVLTAVAQKKGVDDKLIEKILNIMNTASELLVVTGHSDKKIFSISDILGCKCL